MIWFEAIPKAPSTRLSGLSCPSESDYVLVLCIAVFLSSAHRRELESQYTTMSFSIIALLSPAGDPEESDASPCTSGSVRVLVGEADYEQPYEAPPFSSPAPAIAAGAIAVNYRKLAMNFRGDGGLVFGESARRLAVPLFAYSIARKPRA